MRSTQWGHLGPVSLRHFARFRGLMCGRPTCLSFLSVLYLFLLVKTTRRAGVTKRWSLLRVRQDRPANRPNELAHHDFISYNQLVMTVGKSAKMASHCESVQRKPNRNGTASIVRRPKGPPAIDEALAAVARGENALAWGSTIGDCLLFS